jgi:hypothetical protein
MKRNILVFGTISGVLIATFMAISMALMARSTDESGHGEGDMVIGFSAMAVAFSFVFVGIKNYRDKQNGGTIAFGKAFLLGCLISLLASTIYVITWAIEYHVFLPDFMDKYFAIQVKDAKASGLTGTALEQKLKDMQEMAFNYKHNGFYLPCSLTWKYFL